MKASEVWDSLTLEERIELLEILGKHPSIIMMHRMDVKDTDFINFNYSVALEMKDTFKKKKWGKYQKEIENCEPEDSL